MSLLLLADVGLNVLPDGELARALANLRQISSGESLCHPGHVVQVDLLAEGSLPQIGLEDVNAGCLVGQRDVDELVEATRTKDSRVDDVWPMKQGQMISQTVYP